MKTLNERLAGFSPIICRLLARKDGRLLTYRELSDLSGLSRRTVIRIGQMRSWGGVKISVASRFMEACGVDPFSAKEHLDFLRKTIAAGTPFSHIKDQRVRRRLERELDRTP